MEIPNYIIKVEKITKEYQNKKILGPLTLNIKKGDKIAIIGANGSGKSTLCEMIANLRSPNSGTIKYAFPQENLSQMLSINFQEQNYPSTLIARDLTDFYHNIYKLSKTQHKLWKIFRISLLLPKKITSLSGGQKQRLNLYLSLFYQPKIFIGDEITTGLDIQTQIEVINFLKKQTSEQQMTLILVTHNWDEIISLCSRVILLHQGLIIDDTTPEKILQKHNSLIDYYHAKINQN
jgi:ABC-2 type transport system ATP-binding protein